MRNKTRKQKEFERMSQVISQYKLKCPCGHTVVIYPFEKRTKKICKWCGNNVYINKREEFKDRLKGKMK